MNMVWHLLWKDIRRFKWWLVAWFGLIGIIWELTTAAGTSIFARLLIVSIPAIIIGIFKYIFIIRVVQEDPPTGQTAFWLTRPIPSWALLVAKACFLILLVGLPASVLSVAANSNIPINSWLSVFSYSFLYAISLIFFCWIAALCTSRLFTALLVTFAIIWVYIGLMSTLSVMFLMPTINRMADGIKPPELSQILAGLIFSKMLIQGGMSVILGGGIIAYHYLTRRTTHVKIMTTIALIFILVLSCHWNKNILPPSLISGITAQDAGLKERIESLIKSSSMLHEMLAKLRESHCLLNPEKADPKTMAKDQAEISARLSKFNWDTVAEVNFDNGNDESFTAKSSDPGLQWTVSNQCGRIAGKSTLGKWAGCKVERKITGDTRALIEVSGDFKISKSDGYQLVALGCTTKAGSICMFFEGEKGNGQMCFMNRGYVIQQRFINIPVKMEKELNGFEYGNETQVFHKMRMVLDRSEMSIYYYADDQLLGILKYYGDIGTITSMWMDLEARDKDTELDVLYDNLRARVAGDTYTPIPWDAKATTNSIKQ